MHSDPLLVYLTVTFNSKATKCTVSRVEPTDGNDCRRFYWLLKHVGANDLLVFAAAAGIEDRYLHDISCNNRRVLPQNVHQQGKRCIDLLLGNTNESFSERKTLPRPRAFTCSPRRCGGNARLKCSIVDWKAIFRKFLHVREGG